MIQEPHLHRRGYYLTFDNGHKYSVVDLSSPPQDGKKRSAETLMTWEDIGKEYDDLGGRYEAILLPEANGGVWGDPIRAHSFEDVIELVKKEEAAS